MQTPRRRLDWDLILIITILHTRVFKNQIGVCTKVTIPFAPGAKLQLPKGLKTNEIIGSGDKARRSNLGLMMVMLFMVMMVMNTVCTVHILSKCNLSLERPTVTLQLPQQIFSWRWWWCLWWLLWRWKYWRWWWLWWFFCKSNSSRRLVAF